MNINRRCKSEGSLVEIESDEEITDAQIVKQRIFDELKRIIVPQLNLIQNNNFRCPFCYPDPHENDNGILYRCPICFQKATKVKKHGEIVPYLAKSQPSFSLTNSKSETLINQALAIEDVKRSKSNLQEISNTLKLLYKARDLLDPVINEIILSASELTAKEIHEFRKDNYPICYITAKQFKDTSDVINMFLNVVEGLSGKQSSLPTNTTSNSLSYFNEVIVNTLYLVNKDDPYGSPEEQKVYVDKFVLKELIQLHEVLGCTIAVIQDAEKKERHKPKEALSKDSDSIELTRKLSAASKASLSHKQKPHKEGKSKKHRSCKSGVSKDRECRGVNAKPVKRPSHTMAEMAKYKECSRGDSKKCKTPEPDKECQKKGLFACCNRKKCKKPQGGKVAAQEDNKKKSISFAESKNNVLLDFKIDGRPIQIKMDKNTKEYLVKSLQKSKPLNITASDEKSPNAQESSNFINSVMLEPHDYCRKGPRRTVECTCDSDDSIAAKTQPTADDSYSRNFETSSWRRSENTQTQPGNSRTSKTSIGSPCRTKNVFGRQGGPSPFVCLNYARDVQTLSLVKPKGSQGYNSDSESVSYKCPDGVTKLYPKSDEESSGIQKLLASNTNDQFWNTQKRLSDPDSKLSGQSVSLLYLQGNSLDIKNIKDESCQKEDTPSQTNYNKDDYGKNRRTSQGTETHRVEYTALRCIAEKDTELVQSLESCDYSPSEDYSYRSLMGKYSVIHNQTKSLYKPCKRSSEKSFKVYTALNAQGTMEEPSTDQRDEQNVCCKCKRALQQEDEISQSPKNDEEGNDSVAIQTSQQSLKQSAARSSQTEDKENLEPTQKDGSLKRSSERSISFQASNSVQTNSDLKPKCYKFPRSCKEARRGDPSKDCRGCLKGQSRSLTSTDMPASELKEGITASTLKESNTDYQNIQNDSQTEEIRFVCKEKKQCRGRATQSSYIDTSLYPEGTCEGSSQTNLEEEKRYITCENNTGCRVRGANAGKLIVCPEETKETQTLADQYSSKAEKESSLVCSAAQTNEEDRSSTRHQGTGTYQESESRRNSCTEKREDRSSNKASTQCSSTSIESKYKSEDAEIQTNEQINQNSDNEQSNIEKKSQSNRDVDVSSLEEQGGSGTRKKDLMIIKIVVPEATAAAIEKSLRDEATATSESNSNLPVAVEIVSSFSTDVKVLRSDADVCSNSTRPSRKSEGSMDKSLMGGHITPVNNLLPPRRISANRVKISKTTISRPGVRVNSESICRCNQLPQNRRYDRHSDSNRIKNSYQGELNDCNCKSCSCPSLVKFVDGNENCVLPSSKLTKGPRGSSPENNGTWRQTVLEAIYRLLFGGNCENFKKGQECEIDVEDTTATVKYSQECQCPSNHNFTTRDRKQSLTYRCNLVSPNFGDLSVMRSAIDRDLISQLGDILKVKSSKLSRKGNKLDLSLVLSFQTQRTIKNKTKETISCITEPENILNVGNSAWGITANFKSDKSSSKKNSGQITSTSFLKNILRKHSCHSILINPLVENSLQNGKKWQISTRESNLGPFP